MCGLAKPNDGRRKKATRMAAAKGDKFLTRHAPYLIVNVLSATVGHYRYLPYQRRGRHFTWSSEPREGLAICTAKALPLFLSYFKTPSFGPVPGIETTTSRSAVKYSTD